TSAASLSQITRSAEPNRAPVQTRKGAYGIRTRAAAVRGRCPRPLDECALRAGQCSRCLAAARHVCGPAAVLRHVDSPCDKRLVADERLDLASVLENERLAVPAGRLQ